MNSKLKPMAAAVGLALINPNVSLAEEELQIQWPTSVTLSGLVQMEARYRDDNTTKTKTSDFVLDELGLNIEAQVHKWANAKIAFIYEEGATDLEVDEAIITLGNSKVSPVSLALGQLYVPFGNFETYMVSDPLTLELAETREKAAQLFVETGGFYGSVYLFNGTTQDDEDDMIDHYGGNLGFAQETDSFSYDVGIGYINDMGDTGSIGDMLEPKLSPKWVNYDYVDGLSAHLIFKMAGASLTGEYVTALDQFDASQFAFNGNGAEPKAWNLEAGYTLPIASYETTFALGYQGTDEAVALALPETRISGVVSVALNDNTTASLEYALDEDYETSDGGTGEDADSVILQLAVEF